MNHDRTKFPKTLDKFTGENLELRNALITSVHLFLLIDPGTEFNQISKILGRQTSIAFSIGDTLVEVSKHF